MIKFEDLINSENNINSENIDTIINFLKNNIVNEFETQKIIIKLENKFKKKKWICRLFQ
jgi:divalent metal cation (Fe/Co/Zn/Cd) transporter